MNTSNPIIIFLVVFTAMIVMVTSAIQVLANAQLAYARLLVLAKNTEVLTLLCNGTYHVSV